MAEVRTYEPVLDVSKIKAHGEGTEHTSIQQGQPPRRGLCRKELRVRVVQVAQLDAAHPAPRGVLVGPLDGVVPLLVAGAAEPASPAPAPPKTTSTARPKERAEVRYLV